MSDDALAWFDELYVAAREGRAEVPWARGGPHPLLAEWTVRERLRGEGRRALVVGAGLGVDAEHLASLGFGTTAFDISPAGVEAARARHPGSGVRNEVANLLEAPPAWAAAFDFVLESLTVQSMPSELHPPAIEAVTRFVAPGGTLLVIATGREEDAPGQGPPWPLRPSEIAAFSAGDLEAVRTERLDDGEIHRWRVELRRP